MNSNICVKEINNPQELNTSNEQDVLNDPMTKKYIENREESNDCLKQTEMKEHFSNGKPYDVRDVSDSLKDVQWKIVDHYSGDGLELNYENKMQLETIKNELDELKIQNELIENIIQLMTNIICKCRTDQITTVKDQMVKIQNEMEQIHNRKIKNKLDNAVCCKTIMDKMFGIHSHVNQFNVTVNGLETAVKEACENKKNLTEIMELSEYMKNQYYLQMAKDQQNFPEQIRKNASEIDRLKADVSSKAAEVDELEKRYADQQLCIDFHQEWMTRVEKHVADMLSIIYSYLEQLKDENKQLTVPNENQKEIVFLLAKQLGEIYDIIESEKRSRRDE
ncbi:uncharacterized protein LOC100571826 [Acyrthosiphon pisum]|uniref:Uncharacterized protein n=1 Tax=Acyrthosiphon pisum TaxID=7029 RepID=A0A8R1W9I1_ACYPI|nr:uncharacterized protein LOC100571826 [Acyrthosiphon pisum]|eukprot:XP_003240779.1 PREDICTED: uncharacterized protein LOC100571826 [Acyrthosiphon pisum]